jgi:hypothetical protein
MGDPNFGFKGAIPPAGYTTASILQNVNEAVAYRNTHTQAETVQWLYTRFRNNLDHHAPDDWSWDYKQIDKKYEDFGNYNYGVVMKAVGLTDRAMYYGAGYGQQKI